MLVSAHLVNVCQHVDEAFDFDGRLVAVVGGNGTGKTNLLRATLYALTGDLHRLGRAGAAVSFSRSDRRPAVTLTVRPDPADPDAEAVLTRRLPDGSRSADRKLVYRGETLTTDDDIAAVVRGWFGVPPKALGDYVFVDQGTLTAVLDGAPADRRKAVDRLIGLDRAEAVWAALGEWLDANRPVVVDEALLADAKARYAAAAARVSAGEAALAVIPRPDPAAVAAHEGVIRRHAEAVGVRARLAEAEAFARDRAAAVPAAEAEWAAAKGRAEALQAEAAYAAMAEAEVHAWEVLRKQRQAVVDADRELAAAVAAAATRPAGPPDPGPPPAWTPRHAELETESGLLVKLAALNEGQPCPTCGEVGASLDHRRATGAARLAELEAHRRRHAEAVAAHAAAAEAHRAADRAARRDAAVIDTLTARADEERRRAAMLPTPPSTYEAAVAVLKHIQIAQAQYRPAARAAEAAAARHAALEADVRTYEAQAAGWRAALAAAPTDADLAAAAAAVEAARAADADHRELSAALHANRRAMDDAAATVGRLTAAGRQSAAVEAFRTSAGELRAALHRDAAPADVRRTRLAAVAAAAGAHLATLRADFRLAVDPDTGDFRAEFAGGKAVSADRLSGGQRAAAAIAYRLATQDLFTSGPRVLVLDEPTEGLDAIRRDALRDVLAAWRASGQPGQFVVVTHDRRLAGVCDKVIDLDRG